MPAPDAPKTPAAEQPKETPSKSRAAEALREMAKALDNQERKTGRSGAVPRGPKARMYNIESLQKAHPDKHYRYVNVDDAEKAQTRIEDGYSTVSEAECEKHAARPEIGGTKLMELPRAKKDERDREIAETTRNRLTAHKRDVSAVVEAVAKEMRDKYGVNIPVDRLLVDE